MYKNKNNIHVRFASAQPHSLQLSGGKNDLFSPSPLRGSGRKCHFCLPQAEVNSVVPRQNERECYILFSKTAFFACKYSEHIYSNDGNQAAKQDYVSDLLFASSTYRVPK